MSKVDYREILRLDSLHYSRKRISISIGSSHHTVKDVLDTATQKGITWPLDNDVTNAELEALLFPDKRKTESIYAELDYAYIHRELAKTGVTLTLLWEEYCRTCHESGRTPYMSTQFGDKYRKSLSSFIQSTHQNSDKGIFTIFLKRKSAPLFMMMSFVKNPWRFHPAKSPRCQRTESRFRRARG